MRKIQDDDLGRLAEGIAAGLSCREIAARLGVSAATAIRWTKRCGLVSQRSRRLAPETRAALRRALNDGAAPAEAAARFGVAQYFQIEHLTEHRSPGLIRSILVQSAAGERKDHQALHGALAAQFVYQSRLADAALALDDDRSARSAAEQIL